MGTWDFLIKDSDLGARWPDWAEGNYQIWKISKAGAERKTIMEWKS